jgi:hypothetical protein
LAARGGCSLSFVFGNTAGHAPPSATATSSCIVSASSTPLRMNSYSSLCFRPIMLLWSPPSPPPAAAPAAAAAAAAPPPSCTSLIRLMLWRPSSPPPAAAPAAAAAPPPPSCTSLMLLLRPSSPPPASTPADAAAAAAAAPMAAQPPCVVSLIAVPIVSRACVRYRAQKAYSRNGCQESTLDTHFVNSFFLQRILQDLKLLYLSIPKILVSFRTGRKLLYLSIPKILVSFRTLFSGILAIRPLEPLFQRKSRH